MSNFHEVQSFQDLEHYLRNFTCWRDDEHIYDFVGVVTLFLALLDNIQSNANQGDLDDLVSWLSNEQRNCLLNLAERANKISPLESD